MQYGIEERQRSVRPVLVKNQRGMNMLLRKARNTDCSNVLQKASSVQVCLHMESNATLKVSQV